MTVIDSTTSEGVRRRPSPRPRPRPDVVPAATTAGKSPVLTGGSEITENYGRPAETGPEVSSVADPHRTLHPSPVALRDRMQELWPRIRGYWVPPALLTEPPPTVAELARYARYGRWTAGTGKVRRLGVWWHWLVGVPVTAVCRYAEWVFQRPGRAVPVFLVWKLFIATGAGPWLAHNIIRPALAVLGWVWL